MYCLLSENQTKEIQGGIRTLFYPLSLLIPILNLFTFSYNNEHLTMKIAFIHPDLGIGKKESCVSSVV